MSPVLRKNPGLDVCRTGLLCVPPSGLGTDGAAGPNDAATPLPTTCRSTLDAEGRCTKLCFLKGNPAASNLPQSTCPAGELCAPCFSPVDRSDSGACRGPGDAPTEGPKSFAKCGVPSDGLCVPLDAIPPGQPMLYQVDCPAGFVCVPKRKVEDIDACFAHCRTGLPLSPLPGACVPRFVLDTAQQDLLQQTTCLDGELCAPCINPFDNVRTGACD